MNTKLNRLIALLAVVLLYGCGKAAVSSAAKPKTSTTARVAVDRDLPVPAQGTPFGAVLWLHPADAAGSLVVAASGNAGVTLATLDGEQRGSFPGIVADAIALSYGFETGAGQAAIIVVHDRGAAALRAFAIDEATLALRQLTAAPLRLQTELTGLCLYRSPTTGKSYAFVATDPGQLQQWELSAREGSVQGRLVRNIAVGAGIGHCVADDTERVVYVADENVGIWRIAAEPESDLADRELLDLTAPRGHLGEEVKGLALRRGATTTHLLAADEDAAIVHVYELPKGAHVAQFTLAGVDDPKFESLWAGFAPAPRDAGVVLVPDEGGVGAFRMLSWDAIATALKLPADAARDPRLLAPMAVLSVQPVIETEPVEDYGDAADDPAIWVHPTNPELSLVIGSQKKRGIEVYDLTGKRLQVLTVGRTNNVDLRQGVVLGGKRWDIVAGSNRDHRTLTLYEIDPITRTLTDVVAAPIPTDMRDPYGLCMYHSARSGKLYVFINDSDAGEFRQWEIQASGSKLTGKLVRQFIVGTQAEGCVADDEAGALYIAEEDVGLWRYAAEPDDASPRRQIDSTRDAGRLKADVEGVAIYRGKDGAGYLVVSNQGADNYALYRREGDNDFIGFFSIVANDELGIDGASETDGLDVTSTPLGQAFPQGLLVVQDGRNITPVERQNFKLVSWERVAAALRLQQP
jgi:3-phytase